MLRSISVVKMELEDYMEKYGEAYEDGNLFDYPLEELEHILNHTEAEYFALIDNRLYELEDLDEEEYVEIFIEKEDDDDFVKNFNWKVKERGGWGIEAYLLEDLYHIITMNRISSLLFDKNKLYEIE